MATEFEDNKPESNGPTHPDETLKDPTVMHTEVPTEPSDTNTENIQNDGGTSEASDAEHKDEQRAELSGSQPGATAPNASATPSTTDGPLAKPVDSELIHKEENERLPQPLPPPNDDPTVQHAGKLMRLAEIMAGGPKFTYEVNEKGEMVRTKQRLTGGQIAMGIIASALGGMEAGADKTNPAAAFAAGANSEIKKRQAQDQAERQQATGEFQRKAAVAENNFRTYQNQINSMKLGWEASKLRIDNNAEFYNNLSDIPGAIKEVVSGDDMHAYIQKNPNFLSENIVIPVSQDVAIDPKTGGMLKDANGIPQMAVKYAIADPQALVKIPEGLPIKNSSGQLIKLPPDYKMSARIIHSLYEKKSSLDNLGLASQKFFDRRDLNAGAPSKAGEPAKPQPTTSGATSAVAPKYSNATNIINDAAKKADIDPSIVSAIFNQEAQQNADGTYADGPVIKSGPYQGQRAIGPMQLLADTAKGLGGDPRNLQQNIEMGAKYMKQLLGQFNGNVILAAAAYNSGPGNVIKAGNQVPNIPETQAYVAGVAKDLGIPLDPDQQKQTADRGLDWASVSKEQLEKLPESATKPFGQVGPDFNIFVPDKANGTSQAMRMVQSKQMTPEGYNAWMSVFNSADGSLHGEEALRKHREMIDVAAENDKRDADRAGKVKDFEAIQNIKNKANQEKNKPWGNTSLTDSAAFYNSLDEGQKSVVDQIYSGKAEPKDWGYILARNPGVLEAVAKAHPDFDGTAAVNYPKVYANFTSGKVADQIAGGATAFKHLGELERIRAAAPMQVNVWGTQAHNAYMNKLDTVAGELIKFYGLPSTNEMHDHMLSTLGAFFNKHASIVEQAKSMGDRMSSLQNMWGNGAPNKVYQSRMPGVDDEALYAWKSLDPHGNARYWDMRKELDAHQYKKSPDAAYLTGGAASSSFNGAGGPESDDGIIRPAGAPKEAVGTDWVGQTQVYVDKNHLPIAVVDQQPESTTAAPAAEEPKE